MSDEKTMGQAIQIDEGDRHDNSRRLSLAFQALAPAQRPSEIAPSTAGPLAVEFSYRPRIPAKTRANKP